MGKWYSNEKPQYREKIQYRETSMQSVFILGRLGKDPETRAVGNTQVTKFSVATGYKKSDGSQHTDWHNIEAWNKTGEIASKYLHKGDQVCIVGQIRYNKKDDKTYTNIIADKIELLGSRQQQGAAKEPTLDDIPPIDDMDVPF